MRWLYCKNYASKFTPFTYYIPVVVKYIICCCIVILMRKLGKVNQPPSNTLPNLFETTDILRF